MNLGRLFGIWRHLSSLPSICAAAPNPAWTKPFPPFRIAGNLYYVGSEDLASYLIVTPKGDILINSSLESSVPLIRKSVETLGFHFSDIKILLISHAHYDHCAGSARIKQLTGAKYYVMDADVSVVESGGKTDFQYGAQPDMRFPPARVDRILHDGSTVSLGGTVLTAHLTAGHTRGTTTWTLDEIESRPRAACRHCRQPQRQSRLQTRREQGLPPHRAGLPARLRTTQLSALRYLSRRAWRLLWPRR